MPGHVIFCTHRLFLAYLHQPVQVSRDPQVFFPIGQQTYPVWRSASCTLKCFFLLGILIALSVLTIFSCWRTNRSGLSVLSVVSVSSTLKCFSCVFLLDQILANEKFVFLTNHIIKCWPTQWILSYNRLFYQFVHFIMKVTISEHAFQRHLSGKYSDTSVFNDRRTMVFCIHSCLRSPDG